MAAAPQIEEGFSPRLRWRVASNVLVSVAAFLAVVALLNFLASRHPFRIELGSEQRFQLTPLTKQLLGSLTNDVQVVVFYDPDDGLFGAVTGLLREYQFASRRMKVKTVDYTRYPEEALLVKTKYKLPTAEDRNMVIFEAGARSRILLESELSDYDLSEVLSGTSREVKRSNFKGEQLFNSALLSVSDTQTPRAYFLEDHWEHQLEDEASTGYSRFREVMRTHNVQVDRLSFRATNDVPIDCQLLVIAGPRLRFAPDELSAIDRYLEQGGRALILFNYVSATNRLGLEPLLAKWGIQVQPGVLLDAENATRGQQNVLSTRIGTHPIVRPLVMDQLPIDVMLPRPILPVKSKSAEAPQVDALALTGDRARICALEGGVLRPRPQDPQGSFPFLAAAERGNIKGVTPGRGITRLVVGGDSFFLCNSWIDRSANSIFAGFAVNWLLDRSILMGGVGPRAIKAYTITLTQTQFRNVRLLLLAGCPGLVLLTGTLVWYRRRR